MATVAELLAAIDQIAPFDSAFTWDRVGLQLGEPETEVQIVGVSLDSGLGAAKFAVDNGVQALVVHHPPIWEPLRSLREPESAALMAMVRANIAVVAAHTNWDAANSGVSDSLAAAIGLEHVVPFGPTMPQTRTLLCCYVPKEQTESVLAALFAAGAGRIGSYEMCSASSEVTGTFLPLAGAKPAIGECGVRQSVREDRIEVVFGSKRTQAVLEALRHTHPYEEPVYWTTPMGGQTAPKLGRIGTIAATDHFAFKSHLELSLGTSCWAWPSGGPVRTVAVAGGAGGSLWRDALAVGADTLVTGEIKQDEAVGAQDAGIGMYACGHFATEQPGMAALCGALACAMPNLEFVLHEPSQGQHGRPAH